jgi:hypothetical protein
MAFTEKRSHYRMQIRVPVFIRGKDENGKDFFELTHTLNVGAGGAALLCQHPLKMDTLLSVTIPAPINPKLNDSMDTNKETPFLAQVTRIEGGDKGSSKKVCVHFNHLLYE